MITVSLVNIHHHTQLDVLFFFSCDDNFKDLFSVFSEVGSMPTMGLELLTPSSRVFSSTD